MKKYLLMASCLGLLPAVACTQSLKSSEVPASVKTAFAQKFPTAQKVTWEKENGNFEANWGGKSGEDHAAVYSSGGDYLESENAIPVSQLPAEARSYVKTNKKGSRIKEAAKITAANGAVTYEAEVNGKDLIFDANGNYVKSESNSEGNDTEKGEAEEEGENN